MMCVQDLWAIKSYLEDFREYCTCEEALDNLLDELEKEIDERYGIKIALQKIKYEAVEEMKSLEADTDAYGCFMQILKIISEVKL